MRISDILSFIYPKLIWRIKHTDKIVYLTFDDGPIPESTPWTLSFLKQEKIKATFFCVADNVRKYPHLYQQILDDGHSVGNHTFNHLRGLTTKTSKYINNVSKASLYIDSLLFRPPYGIMRFSQIHKLSNYKIIMWDILSEDYRTDISNKQCLSKVINQTRNGSIVLFHNNIKSEDKMRYVLSRYVQILKSEGYKFGIL